MIIEMFFSCLGGIGRRHAPMVQAYVAELLEVHPIFDLPEQHIADDFCNFFNFIYFLLLLLRLS